MEGQQEVPDHLNVDANTLEASLSPFFNKIMYFVDYIYTEIMKIAPYAIVLAVIIAGYLYITGNRDGGKKALIAAIVGTVIVVLSAVIVRTVNSVLNS